MPGQYERDRARFTSRKGHPSCHRRGHLDVEGSFNYLACHILFVECLENLVGVG